MKLLTEVTRSEIINKSKSADSYSKTNDTRWDAKSNCSVANKVADYNKVDMNTFWKDDRLSFDVKVKGQTDDYLVTIEFMGIHKRMQQSIKANKNKFDRDTVTIALKQALVDSDLKISCDCPDFKYRLGYFATKNGFKAGRAQNIASNETNPNDTKGAGCKHILAALNNASWLRNIASVIVNYANYCRDNMLHNYSIYIFPKIFGIPYQQAVQLCIDDFDSNGNLNTELESDENIINLANSIGKVRGRFKKKLQKEDDE